MSDLSAYAADCRVYGRLDLGDGRLTDLLNAVPELRLEDARLESLDDGHVVALDEITILRDELYAVEATGARGDAARRISTRATRVEVDLGPYHVEGAVHGTPASDPLASVVRRTAWMALTDVTVRYRLGATPVSEDVATLLVNRGLATAFRTVPDLAAVPPWEAARPSLQPTPRAIDVTGTLRDQPGADEAEEIEPILRPPESRA